MNMLFETNVIELKTEIVKIRTADGQSAYLTMKNAPKAYALTELYLACVDNNVTTLTEAYGQMMGGRKETKGFGWETVRKYRRYWDKHDVIKEYWRTHATDPKELEMCDHTDWVEGYYGKPRPKKTPNVSTPTPSVEIARLQGVITQKTDELKHTNSRLTNGLAYLQKMGAYYEHLGKKEQNSNPSGPACKALGELVGRMMELRRHLTHDIQNDHDIQNVHNIQNDVPLLE
jgi:hypothetical protein